MMIEKLVVCDLPLMVGLYCLGFIQFMDQLQSFVEKKETDLNEWRKYVIQSTPDEILLLEARQVRHRVLFSAIQETKELRFGDKPDCILLTIATGRNDLNKWALSFFSKEDLQKWQHHLQQAKASKPSSLRPKAEAAPQRTQDFNQVFQDLPLSTHSNDYLRLMSAEQQFRQAAYKTAILLIEDMQQPQRKHQAAMINLDDGLKHIDQRIGVDDYMDNFDELYYENGIVFKMASTKLSNIRYDENYRRFFDEQVEHLTVYSDIRGKMLRNEFRYLDLLSHLVLKSIKLSPDFNLRVPFASIIEYRGFTILAMAHSQYQPQNVLVQAPQHLKDDINQNLRVLGNFLNLKEHRIEFDPEQPPLDIIMSIVIEVRACHKCFFILKVGDLMPCDYSQVYESHKRLRPEFLKHYSRKLNADALLDLDPEGQQDDHDVQEAVQYMRTQCTSELVDYINNFNDGMLFPGDASALFHEHGIPLRYMGTICDQITNVFAKVSLEIEMVCRALKKIHKNIQTEYFFAKHPNDPTKTNEFLELVLSTSNDSLVFWQLILAKQIRHDYSYDFALQHRTQWTAGQFIMFLQEHMNVHFKVGPIFTRAQIHIEELTFVPASKAMSHIDRLIKNYKGQNLTHLSKLEEQLYLQQIQLSPQQSANIQEMGCSLLLEHRSYDDLYAYAQKILPQISPSLAASFKVQGCMVKSLLHMGKTALASDHFEQLKQHSEAIWGKYNPPLLYVQEKFAKYYAEVGLVSEAESLYKLNLVQRIKALGMNHVTVAVLFERLGDLYAADRKRAYEHYSQACLIFEARLLIRPHTHYMQTLGGLYMKMSQLLMSRNDSKESLSCLLKAIRIYEKLPKMRDQLLQCYQNVLGCLIHLHDYQKGLTIIDKIWQKVIANKMESPQRFDHLFRQGYLILLQNSPKENLRQLIMNLDKMLPKLELDGSQVYHYQQSYEVIKIQLGQSSAIVKQLQDVLEEACAGTDWNPLTLNMMGFIGKQFFEDQLFSY